LPAPDYIVKPTREALINSRKVVCIGTPRKLQNVSNFLVREVEERTRPIAAYLRYNEVP
jgi:hypothetical protein